MSAQVISLFGPAMEPCTCQVGVLGGTVWVRMPTAEALDALPLGEAATFVDGGERFRMKFAHESGTPPRDVRFYAHLPREGS